MRNLWENLEELTVNAKNPIDLIKVQSDFLKQGTNELFGFSTEDIRKMGNMSAKVAKDIKIDPKFKYKVDLISDYLPDYSFNIMALYYDITFYPLLLNLPKEIAVDANIATIVKCVDNGEIRNFFMVESETQLEDVLAAVFNCEQVRIILQNMKAIIGNVEDEESDDWS